MNSIDIFKDLAIIIVAAKLLGLFARKLNAPQVVGEIVAGLLIGPSVLGIVSQNDFLIQMAEIGVILLMFMAGLETDFRELLSTGKNAFLIACAGVFVPLGFGYLLYSCFYGFAPVGSNDFYKAVFIGTIMTATSVSITVQTLRELGFLKGRIGTTIISAAIIDDVLGIIVLTFVIGFKNPDSKPSRVVLSTILFFIFCIGVGFIAYHVFKWADQKWPHKRRIPVLGLALCLTMAYVAEKYFGIADITGAYVAGLILCNVREANYIAEKMDISSYMLFGPVFFASIGLKTSVDSFSCEMLKFTIGFVLTALLGKIIGCFLMSRLCRFKREESLKIGIGMMTRGEVALIVSQKGLAVGLLTPNYFTPVIILIMVSSILTPILLKIMFSKYPEAISAK